MISTLLCWLPLLALLSEFLRPYGFGICEQPAPWVLKSKGWDYANSQRHKLGLANYIGQQDIARFLNLSG